MFSGEQMVVQCVTEFLRVALGPDPVRHGCDLTDIIEARKFVAALDDLKKVADG